MWTWSFCAPLSNATRCAILNANYVKSRLQAHYPVLYARRTGRVAHELIFDLRPLKQASGAAGITETDVAKRTTLYNQACQRTFDQAFFVWLLNIEDIYGLSQRLVLPGRVDAKMLVGEMRLK